MPKDLYMGVDPGKTPGSAESGAFDGGPMEDRAGKTPGTAEGGGGFGEPAQPTTAQRPVGQPNQPREGVKLDRKGGDPPA